ncbi:MAG: hypothetical protein IJ848_01180 [Alphaproteobacteria bacterium]|nr:hypothetical protein [Alphaproteobacteria bacterium]
MAKKIFIILCSIALVSVSHAIDNFNANEHNDIIESNLNICTNAINQINKNEIILEEKTNTDDNVSLNHDFITKKRKLDSHNLEANKYNITASSTRNRSKANPILFTIRTKCDNIQKLINKKLQSEKLWKMASIHNYIMQLNNQNIYINQYKEYYNQLIDYLNVIVNYNWNTNDYTNIFHNIIFDIYEKIYGKAANNNFDVEKILFKSKFNINKKIEVLNNNEIFKIIANLAIILYDWNVCMNGLNFQMLFPNIENFETKQRIAYKQLNTIKKMFNIHELDNIIKENNISIK